MKQLLVINKAILHQHFLENHNINLDLILSKIKTISEIDQIIVVPHFGYSS